MNDAIPQAGNVPADGVPAGERWQATTIKRRLAAQIGSPIGAGGGTRTHTLSRAPAPKAGMYANFITPAAWLDRTVLPDRDAAGAEREPMA